MLTPRSQSLFAAGKEDARYKSKKPEKKRRAVSMAGAH